MFLEHRFWFPQIPCSNVKTVSWSFYGNRTKEVINQDVLKVHWWKHQRDGLRQGESQYMHVITINKKGVWIWKKGRRNIWEGLQRGKGREK